MPLYYNSILPKYTKFVSSTYPTGVKVKRIVYNNVEVWHAPYTVAGDWVLDTYPSSSTFGGSGRYDIPFTSDGVEFVAFEWEDGVLFYIYGQSETGTSEARWGVYDGSTWTMGQEMRTVSFTGTTEVSDSFYYWLTGNAKNSCTTHSYELVYTHPATCTETGYHENICSVCGGYRKTTIAALGHIYSLSVVDPTCTEQGYTQHTCSRCNYSYKDNYKSALGHTWTDATCTTPKTCSVCGATEGSALGHTWIAATCTTPKTCSVCSATEGDSLGHSWNTPTYSWNSNNTECTAIRTCKNNSAHIETCTSTVTNQITQEPTCTDTGTRTYYAQSFTKSWATKQTKTETIPATGHDWNNTTYSWSSDKSTCTATRVCRTDSSHKETETVNSTNSVTTAATCTTDGVRTYTANFTKSWATDQTTTASIPATGHNWNATTYSWNSDNSECTAVRTCSNNSNHKETETVYSTNQITQEPTCTGTGTRTYYATFTKSWASKQTKNASIPATGHTWNAATCTTPKTCSVCGATQGSALGHTWNAATCTKPKTCSVCGATEGAALGHRWGDLQTILSATCTTDGSGRKTCTICGAVDNDIVIPALGHSYGTPTYSWNGYSSCTATRTCKNDSSHKETATATITSAVTTQPTCTTSGTRTYTATFSKSWAATQTKTEAISAMGHDYGTPNYSWDDGDACEGSRTCKRSGCGHVQYSSASIADGSITFAITTKPTCTRTGVMTYTATFPDFGTTSTHTEVIPKTDHTWVQATGLTPKKCSKCNLQADYVTVELGKKYNVTAPSGVVDMTGTWTGRAGSSGTFEARNRNTGTSFVFESAIEAISGGGSTAGTNAVVLDTTIGDATLEDNLTILPLTGMYTANIILTGATSAVEVGEVQTCTLQINTNYACEDVTVTYIKGGVSTTTVIPEYSTVSLEVDCNTSITINCSAGIYFTDSPWGDGSWFNNPYTATTPGEPGTYEVNFDNT